MPALSGQVSPELTHPLGCGRGNGTGTEAIIPWTSAVTALAAFPIIKQIVRLYPFYIFKLLPTTHP